MTTALMKVHVLTFLVAVNFLCVYGQDTSCCEPPCGPPVYNISLDEIVAMSPIYFNLLPAIPTFAGVDNLCLTYITLPDGSYVVTLATVYCNGLNSTVSYIISQEAPGVFQVGSGTCVFTATVFDFINTTNCSLYLSYICFIYGDCFFEPDGLAPVIGFSSSKSPISDACLATVKNVLATDGVPPQDYFIAPGSMDCACVTDLDCSSG